MILPYGQPFRPVVADARLWRVFAFAPTELSEKTERVGSIGNMLSDPACLYRYPSPRGRSDHPNGRPPAFFAGRENDGLMCAARNTSPQMAESRREIAMVGKASAPLRAAFRRPLQEPAHWQRVRPGSQPKVRGTDTCYSGRSSSPRRSWAALRPADNHSASRPSSAPAAAQPLRPCLAAVSAPARWSAQRRTSPIARITRAAADAARAAARPQLSDVTPATVATRRGGLFFGIEPAARAIAGGERDRRCSTRS